MWLLERHRQRNRHKPFSNYFPPWGCFPCGSAGKESACNTGYMGLIPGLGRSPGEGNSYPLQYPGLENSRDCGVTKSRTWLSDFHFPCWGVHNEIYQLTWRSKKSSRWKLSFWIWILLKGNMCTIKYVKLNTRLNKYLE